MRPAFARDAATGDRYPPEADDALDQSPRGIAEILRQGIPADVCAKEAVTRRICSCFMISEHRSGGCDFHWSGYLQEARSFILCLACDGIAPIKYIEGNLVIIDRIKLK